MDGAQINPVQLNLNEVVVDIVSGCDHILFLTCEGRIYSMGIGEQGQLGRLPEEDLRFDQSKKEVFLKPHIITCKDDKKDEVKFDRIWARSHSSFARSIDGDIYAWGLNNFGQLGFFQPSVTLCPYPMKVEELRFPGCKTEQISSGQHHCLVRDSKGRVWSFGRHEYGRLGRGEVGEDDEKTPKLIESLAGVNIVDISTGSCSSFAVSDKG